MPDIADTIPPERGGTGEAEAFDPFSRRFLMDAAALEAVGGAGDES
jgi:hypothetical protein